MGLWDRELRLVASDLITDLQRLPLRKLQDMERAGLVQIVQRWRGEDYSRYGEARQWGLTEKGKLTLKASGSAPDA